MLDQLVDKYLEYAKVAPEIVTNWIDTYGKDAVVYQNDRSRSQVLSDAFGTAYSSYSPNSANYETINIKILADYEDWNKIITNGAPTETSFIIKYVTKLIRTGDLVSFDMRGIQLTYKIIELSEYHELFYRANLQLVTNKDNRAI